jgi:hypothetical protein
MRNRPTIALIATCLLGGATLLYSCKKSEAPPSAPQIALLDVTPRSVVAANPEDTVFISMSFEDKNGDVGVGTSTSDYDLFLIDSRDSSQIGYRIPQLPSETNEEKPGLKGTIILAVEAFGLILREDSLHTETDTLSWKIYIKDLAGHTSNTITTPEVVLRAK